MRARLLIPAEVRRVLDTLAARGYAAHIVGGPVRDLLMGQPPKDWDVATAAPPEVVRLAFPRTVPTGIKHGTVTVLPDDRRADDRRAGDRQVGDRQVEVTTYRVESGYADFRHPDQVIFVRTLREDLSRRDFTINAMALDRLGRLYDYFGGRSDLAARLIRAVGDPVERFSEDALRMMRAIRFTAQLSFDIAPTTFAAVKEKNALLEHVSAERIRDEFSKLLVSDQPARGLEMLRQTGLLARFIPELLDGVGFEQNEHHAYSVWEHEVIAAATVPPKLHLRLAALLHDVAKPACLSVEGGDRHFFDHERVGAKMAGAILRRLKYDNTITNQVVHLIRHHMALHYNSNMKDPAIRRLIHRVGLEYMPDLLELRRADRAASGTKPGPVSKGTLRLLARIENVLAEDAAFGLKDLAIDGNDVMRATGLGPGPHIGRVLKVLLDAVLEDPSLNTREQLEAMARAEAGRGDAGREPGESVRRDREREGAPPAGPTPEEEEEEP